MSVMAVSGSVATFAMTAEGADLIDWLALTIAGDPPDDLEFRYAALRQATMNDLSARNPYTPHEIRVQWAHEFTDIVRWRVLMMEAAGAGRA